MLFIQLSLFTRLLALYGRGRGEYLHPRGLEIYIFLARDLRGLRGFVVAFSNTVFYFLFPHALTTIGTGRSHRHYG